MIKNYKCITTFELSCLTQIIGDEVKLPQEKSFHFMTKVSEMYLHLMYKGRAMVSFHFLHQSLKEMIEQILGLLNTKKNLQKSALIRKVLNNIGVLTRKEPHLSLLAFRNVDIVLMGEYFLNMIFLNFKTTNIDVL
uniref:Uncharacterized protein n=1 Tax=Salix viminalis TaxID=40686 RepID=A0A6N2L1I5_SALVM